MIRRRSILIVLILTLTGCSSKTNYITLESSLKDHYIIGETAERYAIDGRITVNDVKTDCENDLKRRLVDGDVVAVTMEHPLIAPDGTHRYVVNAWTIHEGGP